MPFYKQKINIKGKKWPVHIQLESENGPIHVKVRHNVRAKRYNLRVANQAECLVLTIPRYGSLKQAQAFALSHIGWIEARLKNRPKRIPIEPGIMLPFRGKHYQLCATGEKRGSITIEEGTTIKVAGAREHFERRVIDWLKGQAKLELLKSSHYHAENLGLRFNKLTVRDTKTRWGSCSSLGSLNYSWRLIMAPVEILDYVAAHEVAHLKEMNHGPAFWALVSKTCPQMQDHRAWLKRNGNDLHLYGS